MIKHVTMLRVNRLHGRVVKGMGHIGHVEAMGCRGTIISF